MEQNDTAENFTAVFFFFKKDKSMDRENSKWKNGYIYAVRLLSIVNRGSGEILKKLVEKGYEKELADDIIAALESKGILNDTKLSRETVKWGIQGKRLGRLRLQFELKKRGIQSEQIQDALSDYSKETESGLAKTLAEEKWVKLQKIEPKLRKKRIYDFLIRRGFNFELSREVIENIETSNENI